MTEEPTALDIILQQIETLLIFIQRPVLQRQIGVIVLIFLLVAVVPVVARRWLRSRVKGRRSKTEQLPWQRGLLAVRQLYAPLVGLALAYGAIWVFRLNEYPAGLLTESLNFFWLWLAYRAILVILYARYGEAVEPYQKWVFLPLFSLIIAARMFSSLVNLRLLADITLLTIGDDRITLGNLIAASIVLYWILIAAWLVEKAIQRVLSPRFQMEPGLINSVSTVTRYSIIGIAFLAALFTLGFDLSALAIIGGGLSIGIGIGLQQIVANFISGLVLIFEQALRPGDVIELNGKIARVEKINMRATTIRTRDNVEIIVPNESFVTNEVTTYTKTDRRVRVLVPFGISYNSDPNEVRRLVLQMAAEHEMVLPDPPPSLLFRAFGESSLDFELAVWMERPARRPRLVSDLYFMLWEVFKKHNITIPFPQRDLHLRTGWDGPSVPAEDLDRAGEPQEEENSEIHQN